MFIKSKTIQSLWDKKAWHRQSSVEWSAAGRAAGGLFGEVASLPPSQAYFLVPPPGLLSESEIASIIGVYWLPRTWRVALGPNILLVAHQSASGCLRQKSHFLCP